MTSFAHFADEYFAAPATPVAHTTPKAAGAVEASLTQSLVVLAAQLAAVDGAPKQAEYLAFQSLFVAEGVADVARLRRLFDSRAASRGATLHHARQVAATTQPALRQEIFARFVRIASADGMLNAAEMEWLRAVGKCFGLPAELVRQSIAQCFTHAATSPYAVLGVEANVSDDLLRRAYMARVHACHPDRFQAAGASADTIAMLSQQIALVNAAYDLACAQRARKMKSAFPGRRKSGAKTQRSVKAAA